jgi:hypothetical protein
MEPLDGRLGRILAIVAMFTPFAAIGYGLTQSSVEECRSVEAAGTGARFATLHDAGVYRTGYSDIYGTIAAIQVVVDEQGGIRNVELLERR